MILQGLKNKYLINEEEYLLILSLLERWETELTTTLDSVDDLFPHPMRESIKKDLAESISKLQSLIEGLKYANEQ